MSDKSSVIRHAVSGRFLVIYKEYIDLCKSMGIDPADAGAGILRVFEQWTNNKLARKEIESERSNAYAKQGEHHERQDDLWIWMPQEALKKNELLDMFGERSVASALKGIIEAGYLEVRRNPKHTWDRTLQYRLNVSKMQEDLDNLQNCTIALPQNAPFDDSKVQPSIGAERGDREVQSAPSNTTVHFNNSSQEKNSAHPADAARLEFERARVARERLVGSRPVDRDGESKKNTAIHDDSLPSVFKLIYNTFGQDKWKVSRTQEDLVTTPIRVRSGDIHPSLQQLYDTSPKEFGKWLEQLRDWMKAKNINITLGTVIEKMSGLDYKGIGWLHFISIGKVEVATQQEQRSVVDVTALLGEYDEHAG